MRADELDALVHKLDELSFTGTKLQTHVLLCATEFCDVNS
jgi:hypothetical protein